MFSEIKKKKFFLFIKESINTRSSINIPSSSTGSTSSNASVQSLSTKLDQKLPKNQNLASYARSEKSLTALTTKFMTLLQECEDGILDLRSVSLLLVRLI